MTDDEKKEFDETFGLTDTPQQLAETYHPPVVDNWGDPLLPEEVQEQTPEQPQLIWAQVDTNHHGERLYRTQVRNGWLVKSTAGESSSITFIPDPAHTWN